MLLLSILTPYQFHNIITTISKRSKWQRSRRAREFTSNLRNVLLTLRSSASSFYDSPNVTLKVGPRRKTFKVFQKVLEEKTRFYNPAIGKAGVDKLDAVRVRHEQNTFIIHGESPQAMEWLLDFLYGREIGSLVNYEDAERAIETYLLGFKFEILKGRWRRTCLDTR